MTTVSQDLRYAVRRLARAPGFTGVAVLTLALGIGANTAMFSVIRSVLLAPLPYAEPERVVTLWNRWKGWEKTWLSEPEVMDYRRQVKSLEAFAAYTDGAANLTGGTRPERVALGTVTANTFAALGVAPMLGRVFTAEEDRPGHDDVVVLGYGLWRRRFAGDPRILGQAIQLNGRSRVVLGVMPPGFQLPTDYAATQPTELWLPLALNPDSLGSRGSHYLYGVGRLRKGTTPEAANAELKLVADQWRRDGLLPPTSDQRTFAVAVTDDVFGKVRPALLVLLGAVAFLLLIACANVANLLLVRSDGRQREIAVRSALGAARRRIAAQLLVESVALAVLGAAVGAVLAVVGVKLLVALNPTSIPRVSEVRVDGVVLSGTVLLALATGVLFGAVPAVHASRPDLVSGLREGGRGLSMGRARQHVRRLLVVVEVAAAVVLVIGAGLMVRSFRELRRIDVGFSAERALSLRISLPRAGYADNAAVASFYEELLRRVRELPGVKAAGAVRILPFTGEMGDWSISVEGKPSSPEENPHADWQVVTPGYFQAVGMRLRRGRLPAEGDRADAPLVAVVN
jgi:putative ABC transport system permease protein